MRRLLVLGLLALSLTGCGNGDGGPAETADQPEPGESGPERTTTQD